MLLGSWNNVIIGESLFFKMAAKRKKFSSGGDDLDDKSGSKNKHARLCSDVTFVCACGREFSHYPNACTHYKYIAIQLGLVPLDDISATVRAAALKDRGNVGCLHMAAKMGNKYGKLVSMCKKAVAYDTSVIQMAVAYDTSVIQMAVMIKAPDISSL